MVLFSSALCFLIKTTEHENPKQQNVYITSNLHSDSTGRIRNRRKKPPTLIINLNDLTVLSLVILLLILF
jgi:hypothetical protein